MVAQDLAAAIVAGLIAVVLLLVFVGSMRVIRPYEAGILTMFGAFKRRLNPGIAFVPLFSHVIRVDLRTQVGEFGPGPVVSKDNLTAHLGASVRFRVVDPAKAVFTVREYRTGTISALESALRGAIGEMPAGAIPGAAAALNARLQLSLSETASPWGIVIESVEVRPLGLGGVSGSDRLPTSGSPPNLS